MDTEHSGSGAAPPPPVPPRRRRRGLRGLLAVLLVLALSLGAAVLVGPGPWPWGRDEPVDRPPIVGPIPRPTDRPAPGAAAATAPLGTPPPPPADGGAYAFVTFQEDGTTPVAYDPCRQVHYVLRSEGAPDGGDEIVHAAFARLGEVTGLQFMPDGASDEPLARGRSVYQPERYGDRWAPVLVGWQTEEENPALAGDVVGEAASVPVSLGGGPRIYVTGTVALDAPELSRLLDDPDDVPVVRGIVLHELGHLVGLGHVDDDTQLMYPEAQREVTDYADGDLTGLARLGGGPCVPEL